jgi:hypothetical protein
VNWSGDLGKAIAECRRWADVGASHVSINTMGAGLSSVEEHVEILGAIAGELGLGASASV